MQNIFRGFIISIAITQLRCWIYRECIRLYDFWSIYQGIKGSFNIFIKMQRILGKFCWHSIKLNSVFKCSWVEVILWRIVNQRRRDLPLGWCKLIQHLFRYLMCHKQHQLYKKTCRRNSQTFFRRDWWGKVIGCCRLNWQRSMLNYLKLLWRSTLKYMIGKINNFKTYTCIYINTKIL